MLSAMWVVAKHGVVWVALVHLVTAVVFTLIRQLVVNRIVDARALSVLAALVPGVIVSMSMLAVALPVRLLTPPGFTSMVLIVLAGGIGGLIGLGISRSARHELVDVLAKLRG